MHNWIMEKDKEKRLSEYVIDKILDGFVFFLGNEDIVRMHEQVGGIKFERTYMDVKLRKYNERSTLYFLKKDEKLKNYSSDVYKPVGANWETLFGFYIEEDLPMKVHVYFVGEEFNLDKLSEMVYSLFTDTEKDHINVNNISYN